MFIGEPSLEWIIQPQIRLPIASSVSCLPSRTSMTPGNASAALLSIPLIFAWACGLLHEHGVFHARHGHIVRIAALACDEPLVFLSRDSRANSFSTHFVFTSLRRTAIPLHLLSVFRPGFHTMACGTCRDHRKFRYPPPCIRLMIYSAACCAPPISEAAARMALTMLW